MVMILIPMHMHSIWPTFLVLRWTETTIAITSAAGSSVLAFSLAGTRKGRYPLARQLFVITLLPAWHLDWHQWTVHYVSRSQILIRKGLFFHAIANRSRNFDHNWVSAALSLPYQLLSRVASTHWQCNITQYAQNANSFPLFVQESG